MGPLSGGDEHTLFFDSSGDQRVYKTTFGDNFGCTVAFYPLDPDFTGRHFFAKGNDNLLTYLERWETLNRLGDYQTTLEAIIPCPRKGPLNLPRVCISQPILPKENPTESQLRTAFSELDFQHVSEGAYYRPEDNVLLTDAFPRNVRVVNDLPVPFDAIATVPDKDLKSWLLDRVS